MGHADFSLRGWRSRGIELAHKMPLGAAVGQSLLRDDMVISRVKGRLR